MGDFKRLQVSVAEACFALEISRATLYRMKNAGEIEVTKTRGRTHVPVYELQRLVPEKYQATEMPVGHPVAQPKKLKVKKRKLFPSLAR